VEKQPLFISRTGGYHVYRVPGIAATPSGVLLATAEARRGGGGDWEDNDVVLRRSTDGGRSWDPQRVIVASATYGAGPMGNFCLVADPVLRCTHAVFCHNSERIFATRTDDDGLTFAEPREITDVAMAYRDDYEWRVIATGPGHGIRTAGGRLIVPLWMSDGSGNEFGAGRRGHRPSCVGGIYSDDGGESWNATQIVMRDHQNVPYRHSTAAIINPSETAPIELSDGRILFTTRSESFPHKRLVSVSADGATGWSTPRFDDDLFETVCMASILRFNDSGGVLFVAPDTMEDEIARGSTVNCDRKRLSAKLSTNDCASWRTNRVIEEGPSGYSDLAILGDAMFCIYEQGYITRMTDNECCMVARFDRSWVEAGEPMGSSH